MVKARWEHYEHSADIGVRGFGKTKEQAFEQAALALTAVMVEPEKIEPKEKIIIHCREQDDALLLFNWLNSILYEMAKREMVFGRFDVSIEGNELEAEVLGEPICIERHRPAVEVKAATLLDIKVQKQKDGNWIAQCVVDV